MATTNRLRGRKAVPGGWVIASAGVTGTGGGAGVALGVSRAATGRGSCSNDGRTSGVGWAGSTGLGVRLILCSLAGRGPGAPGSVGWGDTPGAEDSRSSVVVWAALALASSLVRVALEMMITRLLGVATGGFSGLPDGGAVAAVTLVASPSEPGAGLVRTVLAGGGSFGIEMGSPASETDQLATVPLRAMSVVIRGRLPSRLWAACVLQEALMSFSNGPPFQMGSLSETIRIFTSFTPLMRDRSLGTTRSSRA